MILSDLSDVVVNGKTKEARRLVSQAIEADIPLDEILNTLIDAMTTIGDRFREKRIYIPEMLLASRAMSSGLKMIAPLMSSTNAEPLGVAVIGTVRGDLHDIGKNLVGIMLKSVGVDVYDIGIDAPPELFIKKAVEVEADILCISALLTTTMAEIGNVISQLHKDNLRDQYYVMVGGAPVTSQFAREVGANCYTENALLAAQAAKEYLARKR